ncbi:hypothetical protein BOTNAR_0286g00010 [Botryotinia narcissicola]|uniref:Uncharacterized protein n=1 Tax=Botryotinia narcissicola TaxID=278944 RepID=A0A4Z1HXN7_9HELO|nr:hypothetical protein BOTNAR_0286g00010 [Botryotinia narcissicola]
MYVPRPQIFITHLSCWLGLAYLQLDMTAEKGDEEAISPTLAYRENEKTGGFFGLFKKGEQSSTKIVESGSSELKATLLSCFSGRNINKRQPLALLLFRTAETPPLDYGLSHPIDPPTIETDHPPKTSPAYIAATSLNSKRRGFRRSWTAPINELNFIVGNTGFGAVPYGRPIEDIRAGACIVNRQECMDWKNNSEGKFEEQILLESSKIHHVYFPVRESHDNSQTAKIVQKEHLNASLSNCSALFLCARSYGQGNTGVNPSATLNQPLDDHAGGGKEKEVQVRERLGGGTKSTASNTHGEIHVLRWDNYPEPLEEISVS